VKTSRSELYSAGEPDHAESARSSGGERNAFMVRMLCELKARRICVERRMSAAVTCGAPARNNFGITIQRSQTVCMLRYGVAAGKVVGNTRPSRRWSQLVHIAPRGEVRNVLGMSVVVFASRDMSRNLADYRAAQPRFAW